MNTKQLSYIVTIAEQQNLSAAAAKLGVSQPALSKYLTKLQEELGLELFFRYRKKLILTSAGHIYVNGAKQIINIKEQAYQSINRLQYTPTVNLTIGATPLRGSIQIAQAMPSFLNRYPHYSVSIREGYMDQLRTDVRAGKVDFALGTCTDVLDEDLQYVMNAKEEVVLAVPDFHPQAHLASNDFDNLTSIDIRLFQDTPFILGGKGSSLRRIGKSIFQHTGLTPTIVFETSNNLVLRNMIQSGGGIGFVPRSSIVPSDSLVYFSLQPKYYMWLCQMYAKDHVLSEPERFFISLILKNAKEQPVYSISPNAMANRILAEFPDDFLIERVGSHGHKID